ncbi:MAG: hypothetical protein U0T36_03165 [Saprospiraceae bacterium]
MQAIWKRIDAYVRARKFLVSQSGVFLVKVNVVKQTTSTVFAGVDSGLNHLIRPMLYDAYHRIVNISNTEGRSLYLYHSRLYLRN